MSLDVVDDLVSLAQEHRDFVQTAAVGVSGNPTAEALVCPPANTNWLKTDVTPTPAEMELLNMDSGA